MTQLESRGVVRYLGGEAGHRSFFGGTHSRGRVTFIVVFFVAGLVLTPIIGWPGIAIGAAGVGVTFAVTARTHRGSILDRRTKRRRWTARVAAGTDVFAPYIEEEWRDAQVGFAAARGRDAKWAAARRVGSIRALPDGADGMGWLQHRRGVPGIAWHAPLGEQPYLSVVFSVSGQLRGIEAASVMQRAAEGWGMFLATRATPGSLVGNVQTLTRVLPADTALQEFWVAGSLDPHAPAEAIGSYEDVLRLTGDGAMVQRHYMVVSWPLTADFRTTASKHGAGRDGWRRLMAAEIDATTRGLEEARMGRVEVLTARQATAVMLHQQNPSRPIDYVADVDPAQLGLASHDEFSAHAVTDIDPATGAPVEWWHRTARISAENLAVAPREQLWVLDLLLGRELDAIRSISFHLHLIPALEARAAAKRDLVRDVAEVISKREQGQVDYDETTTSLSAARRRSRDLTAGSHHHGVSWVGYVTITARTREELTEVSRRLEDTCSTGLGIERLDWMDSYQAAASGTTWPIGRGITAEAPTLAGRLYQRLAGSSEKEAIA